MNRKEVKGSDVIKIRGYARIEIGDEVIEEHNTVLDGCANIIIDYIFTENTRTTPGVDHVDLLDANGYLVKSIPGGWGTKTDTGSSIKRQFVAEDTSTDTYTFRQAMLKSGDDNYGLLRKVESEDKTKPSDKKVVVTWVVEVGYES